jgi:hypothetical protein
MMEEKLIAKVHSADFEEDTLTLQLPKDFWKHYCVRVGSVEISIGDGVVRQGE